MPTTPRNPARAVRAAGAAVAALLVSSTIAFGVVPVYRQGVRNMAETERLRGQFAALDDLGRTLAQVEAERGEAEGRLLETERQLPAASETNTFIKELAAVTKAAGLQVDATTYPKDLKDVSGYKALPVEVVGVGDWDGCYKFLTGLRGMKRLTRLDAVVMEVDRAASAKAGRPVCRISVSFSTFFRG